MWTVEHASMMTLTHQTLPGYTRAQKSSLKLSQLKTPETQPPYVVYHPYYSERLQFMQARNYYIFDVKEELLQGEDKLEV